MFITADCGVVHTHKNRDVVGGSRAEDHISRHAVQDVYVLKQYTQEPAQLCPEMSQVGSKSSFLVFFDSLDLPNLRYLP